MIVHVRFTADQRRADERDIREHYEEAEQEEAIEGLRAEYEARLERQGERARGWIENLNQESPEA